MDFDDPRAHNRYNREDIDPDWKNLWTGKWNVTGKRVTELGCGGGTYCRALAAMGAHVTGVDASSTQLETAQTTSQGWGITFKLADAADTELSDESQDVVIMRALIHHLSDPLPVLRETARILHPGGWAVIQDRTVEDCMLPFSPEHLRGHLFEFEPRLLDFERKRRYSVHQVCRAFKQAGFTAISHHSFWETRRTFPTFDALRQDFLNRNNRSILEAFDDQGLYRLTASLIRRLQKVGETPPIRDRDRWTVWKGQKSGNHC